MDGGELNNSNSLAMSFVSCKFGDFTKYAFAPSFSAKLRFSSALEEESTTIGGIVSGGSPLAHAKKSKPLIPGKDKSKTINIGLGNSDLLLNSPKLPRYLIASLAKLTATTLHGEPL